MAIKRTEARDIAEEYKPKPEFQVSEEAVMYLAVLGDSFLAGVSRESWGVLTRGNSELQNNGVRVRLQVRDVKDAVRKLTNDPTALERLLRALSENGGSSRGGSGAT